MKVGVVLPQPPEDMGGWLADAAAFDTAGADALWIDPLADAGLDPLVLTAALATLTFRALLVSAVADGGSAPPQARARTLATLSRLSHGRFALCGERTRLAEVASGSRSLPEFFHRVDAGTYVRGAERWIRVAPPSGREEWRKSIAEAEAGGAAGLLVPADPRLLDILRNPDDPGDRQDLQIAVG